MISYCFFELESKKATGNHINILRENYKYIDSCFEASDGEKSKKGALRKFAKFIGKHLCQSLFFNKVAGLPINFVKFLRTSFFIEHLWWLPLFSVEAVSSFPLLFFLNAFFSNCLEHLKRFCCEYEPTLFQGPKTILF